MEAEIGKVYMNYFNFIFMAGAFSVAIFLSSIQGFSAEETRVSRRDEVISLFQNLPIFELPDLSGNPLAMAIDIVKAGTALIIYNSYGASRVFFDGKLPTELDTIRIVALHAQVAGIVNDGEWNWYIKDGAGQHVEILDKDERKRIIDHINDDQQKRKRKNIHMVLM